MRRASYREGVEWIAMNDNVGDDGPGEPDAERNVAGYISTGLLAALFDVEPARVARDVMRIRRREFPTG